MYYPLQLINFLNLEPLCFLQIYFFWVTVLLGVWYFNKNLWNEAPRIWGLILFLTIFYRIIFASHTIADPWVYGLGERFPILMNKVIILLSPYISIRVHPLEWASFVNVFLGSLTPMFIAIHSFILFKDKQIAIASALLLAINPIHIKFSGTSTQVINSLLLSTQVFFLFHLVYSASQNWLRWVSFFCYLFLLPVYVVARPLNFLIFPVLFIFSFLYSKKEHQKKLALSLQFYTVICLAISMWFLQQEHQAFDFNKMVLALTGFKYIVFSGLHSFFNYQVVSVPLIVLLLWGAYVVFKKSKLLFVGIASWYFISLWVTSIAVASTVVANTRYHLALVYPISILMAFGFKKWEGYWAGQKKACAAIYLAVICVPLFCQNYITDFDFDYQQEYAFIKQHYQKIPNNCAIFEPSAGDIDHPGNLVSFLIGFDYFTKRKWQADFYVENVEKFLAAPNACKFFFCGLSCQKRRADFLSKLPPHWTRIAERSYPFRSYDQVSTNFGKQYPSLKIDRLEMSLWHNLAF